MSLKALYNKCTLSTLKPNGRQAMESPEILDFVVRNPDMFCSDAQRNFYSKKKKGLRKTHTIPRFPLRPPAHEVDFCSEV